MKYLYITFAILGLISACSEKVEEEEKQQQQESPLEEKSTVFEFSVEVTPSEAGHHIVTLNSPEGELQVFKEGTFTSLEEEDGKYIIEGGLPQLGRILISLDEQILVVIEEGEFKGTKEDGKVVINEPGENYNLQWFNQQYENVVAQKNILDQEYMSKGDIRQNPQLQQEYSSQLAQLDIAFEEKLRAFNDTITPSFVGMLATSRLFKENNMTYLSPIIDKYRNESTQNYAKELIEEYDRRKQTSIGFKAPDFKLQTPEGTSLKLSSLRGKIVLVDFWASWCGPCRKENPNVLKMYNKYKNKGFDIIGISLDKDDAQWKMAIEKDGLTWNHVWDKEGQVAGNYAVNAIPQTFLLDAKGVIIAKNLRGESLEKKLAELL